MMPSGTNAGHKQAEAWHCSLSLRAEERARAAAVVKDTTEVIVGYPVGRAACLVAIDAAVHVLGRLDIAVPTPDSPPWRLGGRDPDSWRDIVLTNVYGPAILPKAALPQRVSSSSAGGSQPGTTLFRLLSCAGTPHTAG